MTHPGAVRRLLLAAACLRALTGEAAPCPAIWSAAPALPGPQNSLAVAALGGSLYAFGGDNPTPITTVVVFDPATSTWAAKASLPAVRDAAAGVSLGGSLYSVGGYDSGELASMVAYDPATDSWSPKASMATARYQLAAAVLGGSLYAIGGQAAGQLADVEVYDPATNTWTTRASLPAGRASLAAATVGGTIYAFGGYGVPTTRADVYAYDPATNTWTAKASMPAASGRLAAVAVGSWIFVLGGWPTPGGSLRTVDVYDTVTDSWKSFAGMSTGRDSMGAALLGSTLYVVGGTTVFTQIASVERMELGSLAPCVDPVFTTSPAGVQVGGLLTVSLAVTNGGPMNLTGLTPTLGLLTGTVFAAPGEGPLPPGPVTLAPGSSTTFTWTFTVTGAGRVEFSATLDATDVYTGDPYAWIVSLTATTYDVPVVPPPYTPPAPPAARGKVAYGQVLVAPNVLELDRGGVVILYARGEAGGHTELTVYDAGGLRVGMLPVRLDAAGLGQVVVDGVVNGRRLGPGLYRVVARGAGVTARTAFAVVHSR